MSESKLLNFASGLSSGAPDTAQPFVVGNPVNPNHAVNKGYLSSYIDFVVTNSRGTPGNIVAGTGIAPSGVRREIIFVQGSGGAVDITVNPQISVHGSNQAGDELTLIGRSDTNTILLEDGNGLLLNGSCLLKANSVLRLIYDGSVWLEVGRNDI